jgi:Spy/CpxP family protein refolding chaperone
MTKSVCGLMAAALTVGVLGTVPLARNQQPGKPWWQRPDVQKDLMLQPEQITKLQTLWDSTYPELQQERDELDEAENRLSRYISRTRPEADVIMQINRVEMARARLNSTRTLMLYRMRLILTADQNTKFQAMQERWQQNSGRGGPPSGAKPPNPAPGRNGQGDTAKPKP